MHAYPPQHTQPLISYWVWCGELGLIKKLVLSTSLWLIVYKIKVMNDRRWMNATDSDHYGSWECGSSQRLSGCSLPQARFGLTKVEREAWQWAVEVGQMLWATMFISCHRTHTLCSSGWRNPGDGSLDLLPHAPGFYVWSSVSQCHLRWHIGACLDHEEHAKWCPMMPITSVLSLTVH